MGLTAPDPRLTLDPYDTLSSFACRVDRSTRSPSPKYSNRDLASAVLWCNRPFFALIRWSVAHFSLMMTRRFVGKIRTRSCCSTSHALLQISVESLDTWKLNYAIATVCFRLFVAAVIGQSASAPCVTNFSHMVTFVSDEPVQAVGGLNKFSAHAEDKVSRIAESTGTIDFSRRCLICVSLRTLRHVQSYLPGY